MLEIEVKARLGDPKNTERSIIALGAVPLGIEKHVDTYYSAPHCDFGETDEALRIRVVDGKYFLTYKGPKLDRVSKTRKEFEVEINDVGTIGNILSSLGFQPVATIVKKRKKYRLGNFSIDLDEVKNLGSFIEIELMVKSQDNHEEKVESIFKFLDKIGIGRASTIRKSYLELLKENSTGNCSSLIE